MTPVIRAYEAQIDDLDASTRSVVAKVNTSDVDRYNTVIVAGGIRLGNYRRNPVVLYEHGKDPSRGTLPVGKNVWVKSARNQLVAKTAFGKDDYSQALYEMYRDGMLRGWSVNILPDDGGASPPTKQEARDNPSWAACSMIYRGSDLAEYSAVSVPGNAEALTMMEARGIWFPAEARTLAKVEELAQDIKTDIEEDRAATKPLPPLEGRRFDDIHRELAAEIRSYYDRQRELMTAMSDLIRGKV